jgi:DNA-binding MarR family transcriptional regulator
MDQETFDSDIADFCHSVGLLVRHLRAANTAHDLSLTQAAVMARLDRSGPMTISDLARVEGIKPQSMGALIAEMNEEGLVERKPHPTDGRQVNIVLTARGATVRKSSKDAKRAWLSRAIAQLEESDRQTLFASGEIIKRLVDL